MIIGLAGYAGSGKDTVGRVLSTGYGFERVAFADKVREMALRINPVIADSGGNLYPVSAAVEAMGWDEAKREPAVRKMLQRIGASVRDIIGPDAWVDAAMHDKITYGKSYVITDVRYPNELGFIRDMRGVVWWVERAGVGPVNSHESENSITKEDADLTVDNSGSMSYLSGAVQEAIIASDYLVGGA